MATKIVIDAGHGGSVDPGAVYKGREEKNDNLKLAMAVGKILSENGVDVVYTRTDDTYQTPFEKAQMELIFFFLFIEIPVPCRISILEQNLSSMIYQEQKRNLQKISMVHLASLDLRI